MNLEDRKQIAQIAFNEAQAKNTEYLRLADEQQIEMNRLQGEYRLLEALINEEKSKKDTPKEKK